jgi:alkylation response protein AidB-like acyl-CoA dehydrogenase
VDTQTLINGVQQLGERFAERESREPDRYPEQNLAELKQIGVLTAPFPPELGGCAADLPTLAKLTEALAEASASTALIVTMPLGLAGIYALGGEVAPDEHCASWLAQRDRVAGEYRAGKIYAACNSEKGAGGALKDIKTVADRDADGAYLLSGEKILASAGRYADYFFSTAQFRHEPSADPIVEMFLVPTAAAGVEIMSDWDGFGMRATESQSVRYSNAPAEDLLGFPNFIDLVEPISFWFVLFAAIPLGCAHAILHSLATPTPASPALRLRLAEALMRYEALSAYVQETAGMWRRSGGRDLAMRVLRTKTYVTQESTRLCAELFALSGGRHYTRSGVLARALADSFAGNALRPPLALALDTLTEQFQM